MAVEVKRTISYPCPQCSCIQKHELRPSHVGGDGFLAVCMECESENGRVSEFKENE